VFVLAVAAVCALAGAKSFRVAGDQAADLPQEVLARLGGRPHPLRRRITAPREKRIRTLLQALDAGRWTCSSAAGCPSWRPRDGWRKRSRRSRSTTASGLCPVIFA
jgi:hypothetical protein